MDGFANERERMIQHLIREGYLKTEKVIAAFREVPRHLFVPKEFVPKDLQPEAYADYPLPIGSGQTISAPHMVAIMTELLEPKPGDKVLEIGAGSGYQAAILAKLVKKVFSIEFDKELAGFAKANIGRAGIKNVEVLHGDGSKGYAKAAPYDKIIITCACEEVPEALFGQLKPNGILIAPVGGPWLQELKLYRKAESGIIEESHGGCVFVPMRASGGTSGKKARVVRNAAL